MSQFIRTDGHTALFIPGGTLPNIDRYGVTVADADVPGVLAAAAKSGIRLEHSLVLDWKTFDPKPWPYRR